MVEVNRLSTAATMHWKFLDRTTGADSAAIDWRFTVGDRVKIRLVNEMDSDHPMHHPFHLHGAGRFLVLARDGVVEPNLVWKDTVLVRTGQVVDILFDVTNPGLWMAHCHIAEHMQSGMMFSFNVARAQGAAPDRPPGTGGSRWASPDRRGCWCSASPAMGSRTCGNTAVQYVANHAVVAAVPAWSSRTGSSPQSLVVLIAAGVDFHH